METEKGNQAVEHSEIVAAVDHNVHHPKGWWNWRVLMNGKQMNSWDLAGRLADIHFPVFIVGMSWGLYGYDNSFVSPMLSLPHFVARYQGSGTAFTALNLNLLISVPLVGAALGSFASVPLQYRLGRKWSFLVAYVLFCIPGSVLQLCAPNMATFVCGRFWNSMF
jgi:MFS family permease